MPAIGQLFVEHYADGYNGVLELAEGNGTESTHDSETLQYFALEAYAYDVVVPGEGCVGEAPEEEEDDAEEDIPDVSDLATTWLIESGTNDLQNCHTHEGGELHCI
jgi:hypothetical protein